jgi:hypothetical protein
MDSARGYVFRCRQLCMLPMHAWRNAGDQLIPASCLGTMHAIDARAEVVYYTL